MKLLLDTHVLLWFLQSAPQLPSGMQAVIKDPSNEVSVSVASYWEIGIKQSLGKAFPWSGSIQALERLALEQEIITMPITADSIERTKRLSKDHNDPFDRIIAATALSEELIIASADSRLDVFLHNRLWHAA